MSDTTIEAATVEDADIVQRLLVRAELPTTGLLDQFPAAYVVARGGGTIVGAAGLETYGRTCLLRSVVVAPEHRGTGLGRALVADRIGAARAQALESVYLLTTTAADYFRSLGFVPAERGTVPAELAASPEFASVCPASASCLVLRP
jgi:amino-acid N-acetyltransferase